MALTSSKNCYFVTWTEKETHIQQIPFDPSHWEKIVTSLSVFFKGYICPVLLGDKDIVYCVECQEALLEINEIKPKERSKDGRIKCDQCNCSYHLKCAEMVPRQSNLSFVYKILDNNCEIF